MTLPPLWPSSLPLYPNEVTGQPQPGLVSFAPEEGLPIERPRVTVTLDTYQIAFTALTVANLATLRTFHRTTLAKGALRFAWVHPITGAVREMKMGEPSEASAGGVLWRVAFQVQFLDTLPGWADDVTTTNGFVEEVTP